MAHAGKNVNPALGDHPKSLILLENEEQVKDYLEHHGEIKGTKQIIALSPFAMYELDKRNLSYRIPEDYYDPQELYRLGMDNYQRVKALCDIVDKKIQQHVPATAEAGITPALFNYYFLKIAYDAVTIRLFQLSNLIEVERPDTVFIHTTKKYPFGLSPAAPSLLFDNRESIYSRLVTLNNLRTHFVLLPAVSQREYNYNNKEGGSLPSVLTETTKRWLQRHPNLLHLLSRTKEDGWHGFSTELKSYLQNAPVLLVGGDYNWNECLDEFLSAGIGPVYRMQADLSYWIDDGSFRGNGLNTVGEELLGDAELCKLFVWDNIDFLQLFEERIKFLITRLTVVCLNAYRKAESILKEKKIRAVLASTLSSSIGQSASKAAQNANVPVITWQHGAYGFAFDPMFGYTDLMSYDIYYASGMGVVEQFTKLAGHLDTRLVPIGFASLDKLPQRRTVRATKSQRKTILYVTTNYYQNSYYVHLPPAFSDNSLWRVQRVILETLGQENRCDVIIKLHPSYLYRKPPLRLYAKENRFYNCRFVADKQPLPELLQMADAILIDWPSTTLLQALTTSKPIFVYLGHIDMDKEAETLLRRRALCFANATELSSALVDFLRTNGKDLKVDLNDASFLRAYGTHLSDGKSASRAVETLKKLMKE